MQTSTSNPAHDAGIRTARSRLGLADDVQAEVFAVHRLDRPGSDSLLVIFGPADRALGVALIDATTGALESSAKLTGTGRALPLDARAARAAARAGDQATAQLAWRPSRASMSPLFPFWEVSTSDGALVYVDQHGRTWTATELATPGPAG